MPLYLLKLRKEIEKNKSRENAIKLRDLINNGIIKSIEENETAGNITYEDTVVLIGLLEKLYKHLYGHITEFQNEEVNKMISEKLILKSDRIIYRAKKEIEEAERKYETEKKSKEVKILEIAKRMLDAGMTVDQIQQLTNIPLDKIENINKQI